MLMSRLGQAVCAGLFVSGKHCSCPVKTMSGSACCATGTCGDSCSQKRRAFGVEAGTQLLMLRLGTPFNGIDGSVHTYSKVCLLCAYYM